MINAEDDELSKSLVNVSPADLKVSCLVVTASAVVVVADVVDVVEAAVVVVVLAVVEPPVEFVVALGAAVVSG